MKSDKEKIEVMQAFVAGQPIEGMALGDPISWCFCPTPTWDWQNCDYRVKAQPRRVWVNYWTGGSITAHPTRLEAATWVEKAAGGITATVEFVEATAAKQE